MRLLFHFAKRFIAGETVEEMLPKAEALAQQGFGLVLDLLGEHVTSRRAVDQAAREYLLLLQALQEHGVERNISVKLTQLGLNIDPGLAHDNLARIAAEAQRVGGFVRVDMEESKYTSSTLELVAEIHRQIPCVGAVVQCMLRRSHIDIGALCSEGIRVRLVKGAYKELPDRAYQDRDEIRSRYLALAEQLLRNGTYPAFGTHDEYLIEQIKQQAEHIGVARDAFEFQMLYGIRRTLQRQLLAEGWRVRIYIPYGEAWMPYIVRRMRERKENVWFVMKNLFRS